ncbi:MAG: tyrosine-type recombinase/integrase [Clostridium sp.]
MTADFLGKLYRLCFKFIVIRFLILCHRFFSCSRIDYDYISKSLRIGCQLYLYTIKMWKRSIWKQHKEFQNLVFTCSDGSPVYYYNVNSAIKDYVAKINVIEIELAKEEKREPKIFELFTCHTLRHTYATRCYENGVDQQVVQKLLGHSTLAMTTDLYTHVSEEKKKEEVAELKILA